MLTLKSGNTTTLQLKALSSVVVSNEAGTASVSIDGQVITPSHTGTKRYGPFKTPGKFVITATSGDVQYRIESARNTATGVGTYATLAELAAVKAAEFPQGTVVLVGPDAAGQYSEWYSNGIRWRPRSALIHIKPTAASLPDTTTTETDLWSFTIPAGLLGPNDLISAAYFWNYTNNTTLKDMKLYFGEQVWMQTTTNAGAGFRGTSYAAMRNSQVNQVWASALHGVAYADGSNSSGGSNLRTVDTKQDVVIKAAAKWASGAGGTNKITLEYVAIRLEFEA